MMCYIYTLSDPRDNAIRYVGYTPNIDRRFNEHCRKQYENNHRAHWLMLLRSLGLKPIMEIIEECNEDTWQNREIYWIIWYREQGHQLVNDAIGGKGGAGMLGKHHTEETKRKQRNSHKSRVTEDFRQVISIRMKDNKSKQGQQDSQDTKNKKRQAHQGEKSYRSVFTNDIVLLMRYLYDVYGMGTAEVSKALNTNYWATRKVVKRMTWTHLP
jgi:hypothetical protein